MSVQIRTGHGWTLGRDGTWQPDANGAEGARCGGPGLCPACSQDAAEVGFRGSDATHAFVAEQPREADACLLFVGPDRVCAKGRGDPVHQQPVRATEEA